MKVAFESMPCGRASGTDFGTIDYIKYAEAFGATGLIINTPDDAAPVDRPEGATAHQASGDGRSARSRS